jgi:hypothetical protein
MVRPLREATDAIKQNLAADQGVSGRDYEPHCAPPLCSPMGAEWRVDHRFAFAITRNTL